MIFLQILWWYSFVFLSASSSCWSFPWKYLPLIFHPKISITKYNAAQQPPTVFKGFVPLLSILQMPPPFIPGLLTDDMLEKSLKNRSDQSGHYIEAPKLCILRPSRGRRMQGGHWRQYRNGLFGLFICITHPGIARKILGFRKNISESRRHTWFRGFKSL